MWPFKKKEIQKPQSITPKICQHKYKDFNWYVTSVYNMDTNFLSFKIYEPYVCIHCGDRIDKLLDEKQWYCESKEIADEKHNNEIKNYPLIRSRAEIEDQINDMVLVDRAYIDIYMKVHGLETDKDGKVILHLD